MTRLRDIIAAGEREAAIAAETAFRTEELEIWARRSRNAPGGSIAASWDHALREFAAVGPAPARSR